jgi:small subunit ribosomal protein S8
MTLVDPIGDMLTRIRNGQMRSLNKINIPFSNFRLKILEVLKKEGYIIDFNIDDDKQKIKFLSVDLKYYEGQPVIKEIKRVSKPGRRVYSRATSIPKVLNGLGLAILSTSKGVMSDTDAIKNNLGGEIICKVF